MAKGQQERVNKRVKRGKEGNIVKRVT